MLLIFDLDNTLIDRDEAFLKSLKKMFLDYGYPLNHDDLNTLLKYDNCGKTARADFCRYLSQRYAFLPQHYSELWQHFTNIPDFISPDRHVQQLLTSLSQQYELRLLTNGSAEMQQQKIDRAGLADFFSQIIISGEFGVDKPDPAIFNHAINGYAAQQCMMIGDDAMRDIAPAHRLGLKTVWITQHHDDRINCDYILNNITQLINILPLCLK